MKRNGTQMGLLAQPHTAIPSLHRYGSSLMDIPVSGRPPAVVRFREFWGVNKRAELIQSLDYKFGSTADYFLVPTSRATLFNMRLGERTASYSDWMPINDLSLTPDWSGCLEMRKGALLDFDRRRLEERIARYAEPTISLQTLRAENCGPVEDAARFDSGKARNALIASGGVSSGRITCITLYPFDNRWCFHTNVRPIWNEPRPEVAAQQAIGAEFIVTRAKARRPDEGVPLAFTRNLPGYHLLDPNSHPIPFVLHDTASGGSLGLQGDNSTRPNLSATALFWLTPLGLPLDAETSRHVWLHALATTYGPAYLAENSAGIRQGWPRIPLPNSAALLGTSAALGAQVAALLDPDTPVLGVTAGTIHPALAAIAVPTTHSAALRDWRLSGWGSQTKTGVMPGRGRSTARDYAATEVATAAEATLLGARTLDIGMNGASFWKNIPEAVWETHIGGYQVLKKWLSYRDASILDRPLSSAEVQHVSDTARRLAALRLLGPALDASHHACAAAHVSLPASTLLLAAAE